MNTRKKINYCFDTNPVFLAYNVLSILYALKKNNSNNLFKYPQKIASIIYFINTKENIKLFQLATDIEYKMKLVDYEKINSIHLKSKIIEPHLNRVLNKLNNEGYIVTEYKDGEACIYLNIEKAEFIKRSIFTDIVNNTKILQKNYSRIASVQNETYYKKIFKGIV